MNEKKFIVTDGPYIRRVDFSKCHTKNIMNDVLIALTPVIIFAWIKNGLLPFINNVANFYEMIYPLLLIIIGAIASLFFELIYCWLVFGKNLWLKKLKNSYSIIPGVMLAMILPYNTPLWILIFGCFFSNIIVKMLFGGFGHNIFNPALGGYIFIMIAFFGVISKNGGYLNSSEKIDIISGVTPLQDFRKVMEGKLSLEQLFNIHGGLMNFFLGFRSGSLAETSALLIITSFIYLVIRKAIKWRITIFYLLTIIIMSLLVGLFLNFGFSYQFVLFNLFSGGVMFGAVFMATEPVTSPKTAIGQIIYAIAIGIISIILRYLSNLPEGVSTAILFMNMFTPLIDNFFIKERINKLSRKIYIMTTIMILSLFFIIFHLIFTLKHRFILTAEIDNIQQIHYNSESEDLNFEYTIKIKNKIYLVLVDAMGTIKSIDSSLANENLSNKEEAAIKKVISEVNINKGSTKINQVIGYIASFDNNVIIAKAHGFSGKVIIEAQVVNNIIVDLKIDLKDENDLAHVNVDINEQNFMELIKEDSDVITGATYTSVAVKAAYQALLDFLIFMEGKLD